MGVRMIGGYAASRPPSPFSAFRRCLLPREARAVTAAATALAQRLDAQGPAATTTATVLQPDLRALLAHPAKAPLIPWPRSINPRSLRAAFETLASMEDTAAPGAFHHAAEALARIACEPEQQDLVGFHALIGAGAAIMNGEAALPPLALPCSEITQREAGATAMDVPLPLWRRVVELLSRASGDWPEEAEDPILHAARTGLRPWGVAREQLLPAVGRRSDPLHFHDDTPYQLSIERLDAEHAVRLSVITALSGRDENLETERRHASLLGLQYLFGMLPFAGAETDHHTIGGLAYEFERVSTGYGDATILLDPGSAAVDDLLCTLRLPSRATRATTERLREQAVYAVPDRGIRKTVTRGDPEFLDPLEQLPGYQAMHEAMVDGIDPAAPLLDLAAKLGRALSPGEPVTLTHVQSQEGPTELRRLFSLLVGDDIFSVISATGAHPYTVVQRTHGTRTAPLGAGYTFPRILYDLGRGPLFVFGPAGDLVYERTTLHPATIPYTTDRYGAQSRPIEHLVMLRVRPHGMAQLPFDRLALRPREADPRNGLAAFLFAHPLYDPLRELRTFTPTLFLNVAARSVFA